MFLCLLSVGRASEKHLWGRRGVIVYIFYCLVILCVYDDKTLCVYVCGSVGGWMISCHALCVWVRARACSLDMQAKTQVTAPLPAALRPSIMAPRPALHLPSSAAGHLSFLSPRVESSTNTPCANRRQPCSGPERGRGKKNVLSFSPLPSSASTFFSPLSRFSHLSSNLQL